MPARSDIDAADIPALLAHLIISERMDGKFRHRLCGTDVVDALGFDATGYFVGEFLDTHFQEEAVSAYEIVYADRIPVFAIGECCFKPLRTGVLYAFSTLILPLSDDRITVNKAISSFITRLHPSQAARPDWLAHQPAKVLRAISIHDAIELEKLCLEWDRRTKTEPQHKGD